jgi:hypothetical protein
MNKNLALIIAAPISGSLTFFLIMLTSFASQFSEIAGFSVGLLVVASLLWAMLKL